MRRALLVLALFLFAALPADASEGRHAEWVDDPILPDVQWNASVDIGYISTAPLVKNGLVIVKGGGDPMTGEGAGIVAYRADTGAEIWRIVHTASEMGFETAPLIHIPSSNESSTCSPQTDLVVTGWTSGHLSAYELTTGIEIWNQSTSAPMWGITGGGFVTAHNEIVWPTETGVLQVCANNGTILNIHDDSNLRTYRANLGIWMEMETDVNGTISTSMGWLQGTESAYLIRYDSNSTPIESIDIPTLANLSGSWRIRSTPVHIMEQGVLIHLHTQGQSKLIRMDWNESGSPVLLDAISLGPGTATTPAGMGFHPVVAGSNGAIHYGIVNGSMFESIRWNATKVVGEISSIQWGEVTAICLPQNAADGSWHIAIDVNHSVEWVPDQPGYLTAGCGSDGMVHAAANDASWLEVRYAPIDWNSIHSLADSTLGTGDTVLGTNETTEPEIEPEPGPEEDGIPGIVWLPFFGAIIFAIVAQFAVDLDTRRLIRIGAVIMVMLGLVMAGMIYNTEIVAPPEEDSSQRTRVQTLAPEITQTMDENDVLVAFHFPASFAPQGCSPGDIVVLNTGTTPLTIDNPSSVSHCVIVSLIEINSESTVQSITEYSLSEYQYDFEIEQQILGPFLRDIEGATGGANGHWWSYDLNGGYGTIGMAEQALQPGDHVDWHFDVGQF